MDRRTVLRLGAAGAGLGLGGCLGFFEDGSGERDADADPDWPQYRYDASNSGFKPVLGPHTSDGHEHVVDQGWAGPSVVADGVLYTDGVMFFALDGSDGSEEWRTTGPTTSLPAVEDGTAFRTLGPRVIGHDVADGTEIWEGSLEGKEIDPGPPTVSGSKLFVAAGESWRNTDEGTLAAFDYEAEEREWLIRDPGVAATAPALADGRLVATFRESIVAFDPDDGTELWRKPVEARSDVTGDPNAYSPAVRDGVVYVPYSDGLLARELDSGAEVWRRPVGEPTGPAAVAPHGIYLGTTEGVVAMAEDGTVRWSTPGTAYSVVTATEETVYLGEDDARFLARSVENGDVRWQLTLPSVVAGDLGYTTLTGEPIVADGAVYGFHSGGDVHRVAGTAAD